METGSEKTVGGQFINLLRRKGEADVKAKKIPFETRQLRLKTTASFMDLRLPSVFFNRLKKEDTDGT